MSGENHAFRIVLPEGWRDVTTHVFQGPEEGGRRHILTLNIDAEPPSPDVEQYADDRLAIVLDGLPGAELLKRDRFTLECGADAVEAVVKLAASDIPVFRKLVFVLREGIAYGFSADFSKKTIKTFGRQMLSMIETLQPDRDG